MSGETAKEWGVKKMSGNDWNGLGRDVKDIVENAINTGDFGALNRDLGVTLENAIGNMARNFRKPQKLLPPLWE